jgi:hypothetical protein
MRGKTGDKRVIGSMTDFSFHIQRLVAERGHGLWSEGEPEAWEIAGAVWGRSLGDRIRR